MTFQRPPNSRRRSDDIRDPEKVQLINWLISDMAPAAALAVGAPDLAAFLLGMPGYLQRQRIGDYSEAAALASSYLTELSQTSTLPRDGDRGEKAAAALGPILYPEVDAAFDILGPTSVYGRLCRAVMSTAALVADFNDVAGTRLIRQVPPTVDYLPLTDRVVVGPTPVTFCRRCQQRIPPTPGGADFHAARGFNSSRPRCATMHAVTAAAAALADEDTSPN